MSGTDEISTAVQDENRVLRQARQDLFDRRITASDEFRRSLLIAANAIQTSRMIHNLEQVAEKQRAEQVADVDDLERDLEEIRRFFQQAIQTYDEHGILQAEGRVEQLTLSHDPLYLEGEEMRKREYFEQRKKRRARGPKVTWTTNPSSRFVSLLKGDLGGVEEVTEEEQRSCISKCAWTFAIIGMLVAISFLIVDFWSSQTHPALSTSVKMNEELALPVVYACLNFPLIPTFANMPKDVYKGAQLWGLRSYTNIDTKDTLLYPKTNLIVEETFLGRRDYCSQAMKYMSKDAIVNALLSNFDPANKCYSCLKIGGKTEIRLRQENAVKRPSGAVTLEFATSKDVEFCFNPSFHANTAIKAMIQKTLKAHGQDLIDGGVVTLINAPSLEYAIDYGFDDFKTAFPGSNSQRLAAEVSVLCNLYFFSGLFFPVKPGSQVRYSYDMDGGLESWKELGNKSNFHKVVPMETPKPSDINRSVIFAEIRGESYQDKLPVKTTAINIYHVDNPYQMLHAYRDFAASLRPSYRDVLLFTMRVDAGKTRYTSVLQLGPQKFFKAIGRFRRYNISLDFATFETEIVTRRPTTSTAEFLTDIFEYVGLFTGVCAYSVLVGPARMYLKSLGRRNRQN